jgi:hypothetical protein
MNVSHTHPEKPTYDDRLLLYVDILGWKNAIVSNKVEALITAAELIHRQAETHNERFRRELLERDGKDIKVFPMALQVQFGAFSDHFVFSMPETFGGRILTIASNLIIGLLRMGFLTRGCVVRGPLFHRDNIVFGKALLEAVATEENECFYPRILVSPSAADCCTHLLNDPRYQPMILDQTGRKVVNAFAIAGTGPAIDSVISLNYFPREIRELIESRINDLEATGNLRHAEKWRYMKEFVSGPVLAAVPDLGRHWGAP